MLAVRMLFGGCGKAVTLIVFRIVLPAAFVPDIVRSFGSVVGLVGVLACDGARRPLFGRGVSAVLLA